MLSGGRQEGCQAVRRPKRRAARRSGGPRGQILETFGSFAVRPQAPELTVLSALGAVLDAFWELLGPLRAIVVAS